MSENFSELTFDQIEIGLTKEFNVTITQSLVDDFAKISGDFSPIHMNEEFAKSTKFGKKIVHGMLLASFLSRMVGMYLPGKHALYSSQMLEFHNPCYVGDKLTVSSIVNDKSESTKIIKIESKITNNKKDILLCGEGRIIVRDD
ncbi:MAG: enoyl-CoA hydratase [Chloroflexi bacterium]|nr:enoyl-CoA hydratase [Chloroflexota bacterium]|tara:strand:+ start:19027 stop:19458 length:432 start_codon:yes stop_codon:yes gene_type:complete